MAPSTGKTYVLAVGAGRGRLPTGGGATRPSGAALMGISHLLIHRARWERNVTESERGRHLFGPQVMDEELPCRLSPISAARAGMQAFGEQDVAVNYYMLFTDPAVDLLHDDVLTVVTAEGVLIAMVRVDAHKRPSIPEHHEEFVCSEVESGAP